MKMGSSRVYCSAQMKRMDVQIYLVHLKAIKMGSSRVYCSVQMKAWMMDVQTYSVHLRAEYWVS